MTDPYIKGSVISQATGAGGAADIFLAEPVGPNNPLHTQSAAAGAVTDPAYPGSGNGTAIGLLKGLYALLTGNLQAVLQAGSAVIGKVSINHGTVGDTDAVVTGVVDSTGGICFPDRFNQTLAYNTDGTLATVSFTDGTNNWTQTMGYTSGLLTSVSRWVKS